MLSAIKELFFPKKDYAGRSIDLVITRLAASTNTDMIAWSYLSDLAVYENTITGMRIYPHQIHRYAA